MAAVESRSPRYFGKMIPRETLSAVWLARPMRCMPEATEGGVSIWTTRSTAPMSMPSSRDEVATRAGSRPALSASSMRCRSSRAIEPWCARATSSPASSLRAAARRSARRRLLTNTMVERWARTSSSSRGMDGGPDRAARTKPPAGPSSRSPGPPAGESSPSRDMSSTGTSTLRSKALRAPASTMVTGRGFGVRAPEPPPRKRATSSSGRAVAERPMRCRRPRHEGARAARGDRARWAPRLVPTSAWISSTMTVSTVARPARACDGEEQEERLGGGDEDVGGMAQHPRPLARPACRRCGCPTVSSAVRVAPAGGGAGDAGEGRAQVALDVHGQRAQGRDVDDAAAWPARGAASNIRRSRAARNAARVLPEPVGAKTRVDSPSKIEGQPEGLGPGGPAERLHEPFLDGRPERDGEKG